MLFSNRLRNEREMLGLKQKEFAEKLNIPPNTYNGYETGKRAPSLDVLKDIAEHLNVSTDYLLGKTDIRNHNIIKENSINKEKDLEKEIDALMEQQGLMLCGEPMSEEDMRLLRASIKSTIEFAKSLRNKNNHKL